jgi:hypothetical protein
VELQTASYAIHADVARTPAAQMHDQANVRDRHQQQKHDIDYVHALI